MAFCARNAEGVAQPQHEIGPNVAGSAVDASDSDALTDWVSRSVAEFGRLDVVVSNASALGGIPDAAEGWRFCRSISGTSGVLMIQPTRFVNSSAWRGDACHSHSM